MASLLIPAGLSLAENSSFVRSIFLGQSKKDMKRSRFTEEQIIEMLKEQETGLSTAEVCRKHGVSWP